MNEVSADPNLNEEEVWKAHILKARASRLTFCTITKSGSNWNKGAMVYIFPIGKEDFIKTKADNRTEDNLDNLPEF